MIEEMSIAGRAMPVSRGNYDPTAIYEVLDFVTYNNSLWFCKQPGVVGIEPTEENKDYWHLGISAQFTNAASLGGKSAEAWQKEIDDITEGVTSAGNAEKFGGKEPDEYAGSDHDHSVSDITDFPTTMPPSDHDHSVSDITDFPTTMPPSEHKHTKSDISDFPTTMPPSEHDQAASTITAGTFKGDVVAPASTAYTSAIIRNDVIVATKPSAGDSVSYPNGTLVFPRK